MLTVSTPGTYTYKWNVIGYPNTKSATDTFTIDPCALAVFDTTEPTLVIVGDTVTFPSLATDMPSCTGLFVSIADGAGTTFATIDMAAG
jgi:hypothetical protein